VLLDFGEEPEPPKARSPQAFSQQLSPLKINIFVKTSTSAFIFSEELPLPIVTQNIEAFTQTDPLLIIFLNILK